MKTEWTRRRIADNDGGRMDCWCWAGYRITRNTWHGRVGPHGASGGWWFDVTKEVAGRERYIGEAPNLKSAKAVALDDAES